MQRPCSTSSSIANQPSRTSTSLRSTAATSARSISAPVASPPACTTRASEWPPSRASSSRSPSGAGLGVEVRAERGELADPVGAFGHEHLHGLDVAEPGAGGERVGEVQLGRVGRGQRGRDAALRVPRRRERQLALRQHDRRQPLPSGLERGRETGDAAPEHENVDHAISLGESVPGRTGSRRSSANRVPPSDPVRIHTRFEPARCTACSAGIGRLRSSTCTICGSYAVELRLVVLGVRDHDHPVAGLARAGPRRR